MADDVTPSLTRLHGAELASQRSLHSPHASGAMALATLNRYSMTKIIIEDPSLHSRRVSGVFVIGDVETEALVLRRFLGLHERSRSAEQIVLAPATPQASP